MVVLALGVLHSRWGGPVAASEKAPVLTTALSQEMRMS